MMGTPVKSPNVLLPLSPLNPNDLNEFLGEAVVDKHILQTRSGKSYTFKRSVPKNLMTLYNNPKQMTKICRERNVYEEENRELKKVYVESQNKIDDLEEDNTALYSTVEDLLEQVSEKDKEIAKLKRQLEQSQLQKFASPSSRGRMSTPNRRRTLTPLKRRPSTSTRRSSISIVKDKGFIRVYVRVRPFIDADGCTLSPLSNFQATHLRFTDDNKHILVYKDHDLSNSCITKEHKFALDRVFRPEHTNEDVFSLSSLKDDIRTVVNGGKVSIFAYGHTGSGKTWTMLGNMGMGSQKEVGDRDVRHGLLQKSLLHIFFTPNLNVHLSVIEVYGDHAYDLIDARSLMSRKSVERAEKVPVKNMDQVLECIQFALENRTIAETQGNANSSRSHCIFRITVESDRNGKKVQGVFNVIDLAGSEKPDETMAASSQIRKETQAINKSLCLLSSVIKAKIQGHNHVPYRDTLLTALLKKDLCQPQSKMNLIINVSPRPDLCDKTLNSLQFVKGASVAEIE